MYKLLFIFLLAISVDAKIVDGIAVVVKNSSITLYEIKKEMKITHTTAKEALDFLIRKKLEEIESQERKIKVSSTEVYKDIKKSAARNKLSVNEFYEAIRKSNGLTSTELKEKIKQKLLSQKLYSAIAYSHMSEPSDDEVKEYYELNKKSFINPSAFNVTVYVARDKTQLKTKIENPMFYSPEIQTRDESLKYDMLSAELATLLKRTNVNSFTPIVPNGKSKYMSFYIRSVEEEGEATVKSVENQIKNAIMSKKREQVLGDYFARLRSNAEIKIIRMPE